MNWILPLTAAVLLSACMAPTTDAPTPRDAPTATRPTGPAVPQSGGSRSDGPRLDARDLARRVHRATNAARRQRGRRALDWADRLAPLARAHSADMARRGFFDHVNPDGESAMDRAARLGVACRRDLGGGRIRAGVSENLYQTWRWTGWNEITRAGRTTRTYDWQTPDQITRATVDGWLDSPGHRRNLLDADSRTEAIGIAIAGTGEIYITQILC